MLKDLVRAATLGLCRQSIILTFAKIPRKGGGTFVRGLSVGLLFGIASASTCKAQCSAVASTPQYASDCAARAIPENKAAAIDAAHSYWLAELVDIAEQNNPTTRIAWERAKQRAESLGIATSEYFPILVGIAAFGDSRQISPFPAAIIPKGYSNRSRTAAGSGPAYGLGVA